MSSNNTITLLPIEREIAQVVSNASSMLKCKSYIIGGFVRDKLLKRPTKDIDIVTDGDGIALATAFQKAVRWPATLAVFKNFGTAQVKIADLGLEIEFVGARKETYNPNSRKPYVSPGTIEDDQKRRDFTINALAIGLNRLDFGQLIDPFNGLQDLGDKIIRTPLDPDITYSDDPLRMIRAIRFATQLGFKIENDSFDAIKRNAERLKIVSIERIMDELEKIIRTPKPSIGFILLFKTNVLDQFFPEMVALAGTEMVDGKGHKDNFYHTVQVVDNVASRSSNYWLRWAAILHDIAKPITKRFDKKIGWTFYGHDAVGSKMVQSIFKRFRLPLNEHMRYVALLVALHLRPISLSKEDITDSAIRRLIFEAGDAIDDLMVLCESDITSKNPQKVSKYLRNFEMVRERIKIVEEKDEFRNWQPPVNGSEIMTWFQLQPCKLVGDMKTALRDAVLDGLIPNERKAAIHFVIEKAQELGLALDPTIDEANLH